MPSRLQIPFSMKLPDERLIQLFFKTNKTILTRGIVSTGRDYGYEKKANENRPKPIRYLGFLCDGWALRSLIRRQMEVEAQYGDRQAFQVGLLAVQAFYNVRGANRYIKAWVEQYGEEPPQDESFASMDSSKHSTPNK